MTRPQTPPHPTTPGAAGVARLLSLVGRSAPPHRPVGELLRDWHAASGTRLVVDEWADHATADLAAAFDPPVDLATVEQAVVGFAQARAGAEHDADAVAADLVALLRVAWPTTAGRTAITAGHTAMAAGVDGDGDGSVDAVGLLARALAAWAGERAAMSACAGTVDAVTGLATGEYLRRRVRELHDQCRALSLPPGRAFGAVVVRLDVTWVAAADRMGIRVAVGRRLAARFRAGETVAAPARTRMVAVMPAHGLERAARAVALDLAELAALDGVGVAIGRQAFGGSAAATFRSLAGTSAETPVDA